MESRKREIPFHAVTKQRSINADTDGMASLSTSKASEATSAINNLLHLEERDQVALLDVIQDYFTIPSNSCSCDLLSDSECDSSDNEADIAGKIYEFY